MYLLCNEYIIFNPINCSNNNDYLKIIKKCIYICCNKFVYKLNTNYFNIFFYNATLHLSIEFIFIKEKKKMQILKTNTIYTFSISCFIIELFVAILL